MTVLSTEVREKKRYKMPKVSVIIPVYNAENFLSETIESVIAQTYTDWEIIAVDDGSTDRSGKILRKYEQLLPQKFHAIMQQNSGTSAARNTAIEASKGEYIAFLDHDDLWLPEKLGKQVELLDSNKKFGMVYSDNYVIDSNGDLKKKSLLPCIMFRGNVFNELFHRNFIALLTVIIRNEVLNKVGMFDPKYKIAEEYDLFLRIAEYYPVDFVEQPLAKYRVHAESVSKNIEVSVDEDLQIMEYWLNKKPELKRELRGKIRLKKARLCYNLTAYYFSKHEYKKAVKGIYKLCKGIYA